MVAEETKGIKNGKPYQAIWRHITPDHLAILPEGKIGACSVAMGCGIRHATVYLATAEGYQEVGMARRPVSESAQTLWEKIRSLVTGSKTPTDKEIRDAISATESDRDQRDALMAVLRESEKEAFDIVAIYDDRIIYSVMKPESGGITYYQRGYSGEEGKYSLDENSVEMKQVTKFEPVGDTTEDAKETDVSDDVEEPVAEVTAAEGCKCHLEGADAMNRLERIKALMAHQHNPLKDEKILTAATDESLKALEDHAAKLDAADKIAADLKKAEDAAAASAKEVTELKAAAAKELTDEEFLKTAPPAIRTMVERHQAQDAKAKTDLVTRLKTAQSVHSEDALKLKTLEQLQEIAALLKMAPVDYSLHAIPRAAEAAGGDYKSQPPPDGYAIALEKRKAATH